MSWEIRQGDCLELLRAMPGGIVQTVVTSPPYWGLRDYGDEGQLGLEPTPDEYVQNLVNVFREVRRVLRDDGTVWLNLGDSYASGGRDWYDGGDHVNGRGRGHGSRPDTPTGLKAKDLVGIPWRVAFALQADGWWLRSDIVWSKPNPMPESVTDRPTRSHEYLFLLSKSARYYYDADAVREEHEFSSWSAKGDLAGTTLKGQHSTPPKGGENGDRMDAGTMQGASYHPAGRNKRSVWTVATQPYSEAHFATFPPKLVEPCILAGSAPKACGECGAPWKRVVEVERPEPAALRPKDPRTHLGHSPKSTINQSNWHDDRNPKRGSKTLGWQPTCSHSDDSGHSIVLDPFAGSGTTGMVALRHNRSFIGLELNPEYVEMARWRIRDDAPLLNIGAEAA